MRKKADLKKILSGLALALVMSGMAMPASAELYYAANTDNASIEDLADLLTDDEEDQLLSEAADLAEKTGFEIRLVTTDDAGGKETREFAEDYFESMTSDGPDVASGASYVIDMDNRNYYVASYGKLQYYLTDSRVDSLLDDAYEYISSQDYFGTFESMLEDTSDYYDDGIADGTTIYNEDTGTYTVYRKPKTVTPVKIIIALAAGMIGFAAVFLAVRASYSMAMPQGDGFSFADNVHLQLTRKSDRLVNHFVTSRRIEHDDNEHHGSSGGNFTTTHTTSGGYSAGGGGRSF